MSAKTKGLLLNGSSIVVGPNTAAQLRQFLAEQPALEPATEGDLDGHIASLSLATKERPGTTKEAKARLALYWRVVKGCTRNDLARAADKLLREATFMPTPAELAKTVAWYRAKREYAVSRARHLVWRHEQEWSPPLRDEERVGPEDLEALKTSIRERFESERDKLPDGYEGNRT